MLQAKRVAGVVIGVCVAGSGAAAQTVQAPRFEVDVKWPKPLPNHMILGSAVGVAVDSRDHVFVVNLTNSFNQRTEIGAANKTQLAKAGYDTTGIIAYGECCVPAPNVLEFDPEGNLVGSWGGPGSGPWPFTNHGLSIDRQGNVWIGGSAGFDTQLFKFARDGSPLHQAGKAVPDYARAAVTGDSAYAGVARGGRAGDDAAGRGGRGGGRGRGRGAAEPTLPPNSLSMEAFGGAAEISFDPAANEGYVADGLRNRRVAVIDLTSGAIKRFWGAYGEKPVDGPAPAAGASGQPPRQFGVVRCAELSNDGFVYVCDRTNNRIQVFGKDGKFVKEKIIAPQTRGAGSVWDVTFSRDPQQQFLYVADGANHKVHVLNRQSLDVLTTFGDGGRQPGQFFAVHSIATDSKGNIYTSETFEGKRVQKFVFKGVGPVVRAQGVTWPR